VFTTTASRAPQIRTSIGGRPIFSLPSLGSSCQQRYRGCPSSSPAQRTNQAIPRSPFFPRQLGGLPCWPKTTPCDLLYIRYLRAPEPSIPRNLDAFRLATKANRTTTNNRQLTSNNQQLTKRIQTKCTLVLSAPTRARSVTCALFAIASDQNPRVLYHENWDPFGGAQMQTTSAKRLPRQTSKFAPNKTN